MQVPLQLCMPTHHNTHAPCTFIVIAQTENWACMAQFSVLHAKPLAPLSSCSISLPQTSTRLTTTSLPPYTLLALHQPPVCLPRSIPVHVLGIGCQQAKTFTITKPWCPNLPPLQIPFPTHLPHPNCTLCWWFLHQTITKCIVPANGVSRQMLCPHTFFLALASHMPSCPAATSQACSPLAIPAPGHYQVQHTH